MTRNELESLRNESNDKAIKVLVEFCNSNDLEYLVSVFVKYEKMNELVADRLKVGGWENVACMLEDIWHMGEEYYYMNDYYNLRNVDESDVYDIIDDILEYHLDLLEDEQ